MKILFRCTVILALILCLCSVSFADDENYIVLDVEGEGANRNEAIESAWLSGIREAVGSFIDSKTELNNDQLTERIVAYSRGLVEKYEVLGVDDSKASQGIYKVKMRLWIVQDLLRDGAKHASASSAEISFSPADFKKKQEELDAKAAKELEAKNAAAETAKKKSKTASELLDAMLERYKPEDFLSCYIPGKPEPVKDKPDVFTLNVELNFNDKLYKEAFVPDLIQVLDQIAASKKNTMLVKLKNQLRDLASKKELKGSDTIISKVFETEKDFNFAVYNRPERFGVRLYSFNSNDIENIKNVLSKFIDRTGHVKGISIELIDDEKEVIETLEQKFLLKYLLSASQDNKWTVHPTIIQSASESTRVIIPITLEMPEEIIPFVKNLKASLIVYTGNLSKGWLGVEFGMSQGKPYIKKFLTKSPLFGKVNAYSDVISVNGQTVKNVADIENILKDMYEGETVTLVTVNGANASKTTTVTLIAEP